MTTFSTDSSKGKIQFHVTHTPSGFNSISSQVHISFLFHAHISIKHLTLVILTYYHPQHSLHKPNG